MSPLHSSASFCMNPYTIFYCVYLVAAFCITQKKQSSFESGTSQLMAVVYGSTIKLQHQVSGKYLSVDSENKKMLCLDKDDRTNEKNSLFKIIPPHQEKGWGESLKVGNVFKLESIACEGQKLKFQYKPKEKCYRPGLETDGTLFSVDFYCHNYVKMDSRCIKRRSIVMLASTEFDGYLSARGSFVTSTLSLPEPKVGLRRWQKCFFNAKPYSGDTFFQLENTDALTDEGSCLLSGNCRIKHLETQLYISVTENDGNIVLESKDTAKNVNFKICVPSDESRQEVYDSDHVTLMHIATGKFLSFNAKLNENEFIHWSDLVLKEKTRSTQFKEEADFLFKAIQVDKYVVQDIYQIVGMTSALCEVFEKITINIGDPEIVLDTDTQLNMVISIMQELKASFSDENLSSHTKVFDISHHKTRLANMLITSQMINVMIELLDKVDKIESSLSFDACKSICLSLQLYIENGSIKSLQHLVKQQHLLQVVERNMVGKYRYADIAFITLFNKYQGFDHEDQISLIKKFNAKDSEVLGLMCTLAFNGRWINWNIYRTINEKLKGEISETVYQTLEEFSKVQGLDKERIATDALCSTCVCVAIDAGSSNIKLIEENVYQLTDCPLTFQKCIQEIKEVCNEKQEMQKSPVLVQLMNVLVYLIDYGAVEKSMEKDFAETIIKLSDKGNPGYQCSFAIGLKLRKLVLISLKLLLRRNFHASFKALVNDFLNIKNLENGHNLCITEEFTESDHELKSIGIQGPSSDVPTKEMKMLLDSKEITDKQVILKLQTRLRQNFNCFSLFDAKTEECQKLCCILNDGIADDDVDIRIMSTELLYGIFSVEETILSETAETYFTCSNEELHVEMKQLATKTDKGQLLHKMLKRELAEDETSANELQILLTKIAQACVLEDGSQPNIVNQNIGYSCGLFNIVLECILEHKDSKELKSHEIKILKSCFTLLHKISRKNKKAQSRLFISFNDFLLTKTKEMIKPMICLLNEIFYRNPELCDKLTEDDINNIFDTAIVSNIGDHCELIVTLQIIIENTTQALPLQEHVARLILYHSHEILNFTSKKEIRRELIINSKRNTNQYRLLLNITHLIATCSTRECQVAESAASQIYSFDDLLEIITDDNIRPAPKLSFIRVLIWTYLITEKDSTSTCRKLVSNEIFWKFIKILQSCIDEAVQLIKNSDQKGAIKYLKKQDLSIYILTTMNRKNKLAKIYKKLLYIIEGVIPFLSGLCKELSLHLCAGIEFPQLTLEKVEAARTLTINLKDFCYEKFCSVSEEVQKITERVNLLCEWFKTDLIPQLEIPSSNGFTPRIKEDSLNEHFQIFINEYTKAYNTSLGSLPKQKGRSFDELLTFFADTDKEYAASIKRDKDLHRGDKDLQSLKVYKLILLLRTLIEKQKVLGLHCFERKNLEKMTLTTLQLLHSLVHNKILKIKSKKDSLKPSKFQKKYKKHIEPVQTILLDERLDYIKTLFELLHHPNDDITYQVLACLDVLLYHGNEEAQIKVSSICKKDQSLILCIQKILKRAQINLNKAKTQKLSTSTEEVSAIKCDEGCTKVNFVDDRITVALDVLVWLCDGQQKYMQDALSNMIKFSGTECISGMDIVSQVSFLLLGIIEGSTGENLKEINIIIAQRAVQALIEMCAGNYKNQEIAFKGQVIISINVTLEKESSISQSNISSYLTLKSSCLELLNVMLEEIDEDSSKLSSWIHQQLSLSNLLKGMLQSWYSYSTREQQGCLISCICSETPLKRLMKNSLLMAYHALRRIPCYQSISIDDLVKKKLVPKKNNEVLKKMWQYCQNWSKSIEVSYLSRNETSILTQVYFPYNPHKHLNEKVKNTLLLNIKRKTPQEKLFDLLKWAEKVETIQKHKRKLKKLPILRLLFSSSTFRHYVLFWLTIVLNLIVLSSLKSPTNLNDEACSVVFNETCDNTSPSYYQPIFSPDVPSWYKPVHFFLGFIHLLLAVWMVLYYFITNVKNMRCSITFIQNYCYKARKGLLRRRCLYRIMSWLNQKLCCGKISADKPKKKEYFQISFFSFQPLYRILFLMFSIIGLFTHGYSYCGCMIYLFLNNNVMSFILQALKKSASQLIIVILLCFVCIYIYAVISFVFLQNYFSEKNDEFCTTLFQCFITVSRLGLLSTLGSGLEIRPTGYEPDFRLLIARTVYDIIFFVVVTTLGLNIVIAILVDRFSEMREEKDKVEDDNANKCLICSIKRDQFERRRQNFEDHITKNHNIWDYIYFMLYLKKIHRNDYNALEKYVSDQVKVKSIKFFPMLETKSLPDEEKKNTKM